MVAGWWQDGGRMVAAELTTYLRNSVTAPRYLAVAVQGRRGEEGEMHVRCAFGLVWSGLAWFFFPYLTG